MKRDCGEGELIPVKWEVVSCQGMSDSETVTTYRNFVDAKGAFDSVWSVVRNTPCSDVRLYAKDKQDYCNCIISRIITKDNMVYENDRTKELWPTGQPQEGSGNAPTGHANRASTSDSPK